MHFFKYIPSLFLIVISCQFSIAQFDIPDIPEKETSVYDYVDLFSASEKRAMEEKLITYSDTTSTQIVIVTISTTKGEDIMYLGAKWGEAWGIGQEKEDNGVLILLAKDDRRIAINTGKGVEHLLTDAISKRIIERDIIPYFKRDDYVGGLNRGADAIFEVMTGEYQNSSNNNGTDFPFMVVFVVIVLVIIFIVIVITIAIKYGGGSGGSHKGGSGSSGSDILEAIILSRAGRGSYKRSSGGFGGWSGGSSSGGGFSGGFGGGSFGGGGASGGW